MVPCEDKQSIPCTSVERIGSVTPTWGILILILLEEAKMDYNIIFQKIFNDIPFIGYNRLEDIPYAGVICNIRSYFCLRSAYSPCRFATPTSRQAVHGPLWISLYKIFVYFETVVHESTILSFTPPTCTAYPGATLLHDYWAECDSPSDLPCV